MAANERSINTWYSRAGTRPGALNSQHHDHSPICNIKNTFGCCEFGRCQVSIKHLVEGSFLMWITTFNWTIYWLESNKNNMFLAQHQQANRNHGGILTITGEKNSVSSVNPQARKLHLKICFFAPVQWHFLVTQRPLSSYLHISWYWSIFLHKIPDKMHKEVFRN